MTLRIVHAHEVLPEPWRNGGGSTRTLLCWPASPEWAARVSVAEVPTNGPFSAYPGIERWFAVIDGAGVSLAFARAERRLERDEAPLHFDGGEAPYCRLVDGPTRDLNFMLRPGQGLMCSAVGGFAWRGSFALRALFTTGPGHWLSDGQSQALSANTLLWSDEGSAAAWRFEPDDANTRAWWMGFTPTRAT